jgi:hypothetical protein
VVTSAGVFSVKAAGRAVIESDIEKLRAAFRRTLHGV